MKADWQNYLNGIEMARLCSIDLAIDCLKDERRVLMNRAKVRKHRTNLMAGKSLE